jgi:hypothetical protein
LRALAYDVNVLREKGVRFDRLEVMEDFDVTLQLLRLGYKNANLARWCNEQVNSNEAGGCSIYRTMTLQSKCAQKLARLHPAFVKLTQRQTKTSWGGQPRHDVIVQWRKAFESSKGSGGDYVPVD